MNWKYGQKARLARDSGVSQAYLCDILKGRRRATPENALVIAEAAKKLGIPLSRFDLLYPYESINPLVEIPDDAR